MNILDFISNNELYIIIALCVCVVIMLLITILLHVKTIKLNRYYINMNDRLKIINDKFKIINDAINTYEFYSFTNFVVQVSRIQKELQELKEYKHEIDSLDSEADDLRDDMDNAEENIYKQGQALEDLSKKYDKFIQALYNYYLNVIIKKPIPISDDFMEHFRNADAPFILDLLGKAQSYE